MTPTPPHFEELQGRLRGLLFVLADRLPSITVGLVAELIDANECGVALEIIIEMLVESGALIDTAELRIVERLADEMGLQEITAEQLRPLTS